MSVIETERGSSIRCNWPGCSVEWEPTEFVHTRERLRALTVALGWRWSLTLHYCPASVREIDARKRRNQR